MALSDNQRKQFESQMKKLKEDGFFCPSKRTVGDGDRYLIISYGGTGADVLFAIKKLFEENIDEKDYSKKIRLLAIDTDQATKVKVVKEKQPDGTEKNVVTDALDPSQFVHLVGSKAKAIIENADDSLKAWINPDLPGAILNNKIFLDGHGAGGTRQIGRLTLFPVETLQSLEAKLRGLITPSNGEGLCTSFNGTLNVYIITGISGGTGSGTVVDLTYLVRHYIEKLSAQIADSYKVCGFVLLPPTGDREDATAISTGNRNGYAALKEINHFMTCAARGDEYRVDFSGTTVISKENIFDICYLVDGKASGINVGNAREAAKTVLSECLLDMICSQPTVDGAPQSVTSFMSDGRKYAQATVSSKSEKQAPRDVDYIYCILGHGQADIPVNLMKAYIANEICKRMMNTFNHCGNVSENDVKQFVKYIIDSKYPVKTAVDNRLDDIFRSTDSKGGPYYVINLLHDCLPYINNELNSRFRLSSTRERLELAKKYLLKVNNETFNVFTCVLEEMSALLKKESDIETVGTRTGKSYSFELITLGRTNDQSNAVMDYLDGLVNGKVTRGLTEKLLDEMIMNKERWSNLLDKDGKAGTFDGAAAIRRFWTEQIDKILDSTIEDFLIKYYSGVANARYNPNDPDDAEYLKKAANALYTEMFDPGKGASPMVEFTNNPCLSLSDFNGHNYMMVPKQAPHLLAELKEVAKNKNTEQTTVQIFASEAKDRISCYAQYTGIPVFKLKWVCDAEIAYEEALSTATVGLHMSESETGALWREFPNLLPRSTWNIIPKQVYSHAREEKLADRAQQLFDRAKALAIATSQPVAGGANFSYYTVKLLPEKYLPDIHSYRILDRAEKDSKIADEAKKRLEAQITDAADKLFGLVENWTSAEDLDTSLQEKVTFVSKELRDTESVLASGPNTAKPEGWDEYVAACNLRRCPEVMDDLHGTVDVLERLKAKIEKLLSTDSKMELFAKSVICKLFFYDKDYFEWCYVDEKGAEKTLLGLTPYDDTEETVEYYLMYQKFAQLSDEELENFAECVEDKLTDREDRAAWIAKKKAFREDAEAFKEKLHTINTLDRNAPDQQRQLMSKAFEIRAGKKGFNVAEIRKFFADLEDKTGLMI